MSSCPHTFGHVVYNNSNQDIYNHNERDHEKVGNILRSLVFHSILIFKDVIVCCPWLWLGHMEVNKGKMAVCPHLS
jgi:hypothetical protein